MQACLSSPGDGPPYRQILPNWSPAASPRRDILSKLLTYIDDTNTASESCDSCQEEVYRAIREAYDVSGNFLDEEDDDRDNSDR